MIRVTCPQCGTKLTAPDTLAGEAGRCRCGATFAIPERPVRSPDDDSEGRDERDEVDYSILRRRRKAWHVNPLGLLLVGALGLATVIALGGVAWKVSRSQRKPEPPRETASTPQPDRTKPASPASSVPPARGDAVRLAEEKREEVLQFLAVLGGLVLFVAAVFAVQLTQDCTTLEALGYTTLGLLLVVILVPLAVIYALFSAFKEEPGRGGRATSGYPSTGPGARICGNCNGSGAGPLACSMCHGRGNDGTFACPICNGRGVIPCPQCGGRGWV
jgi:hypothetical protein